MDSEPVIFEISSDEEEVGLNKSDEESLAWLSELLDRVDGEVEESDDVIVVDEFSSASAMQKQSSASSRAVRNVFGYSSDDDCLVLDSDPDKSVSVVEDKKDGDGSDDLLITGEKGQLACRDYPHPRHLCANFPFKTTPHEKHCGLCHCYVCDSPAPCIYWGNGVASTDHCHSTDKEERWKVQRKSFKLGDIAAPVSQKLSDITCSMIPPLEPVPVPIPSYKSSPLRTCSTTSFGFPNIISQRQKQRSVLQYCRGPKQGQHLAKSPPLVSGVRNIQRERSAGGALAPQIFPAHSKFKRVRPTGGSLVSTNLNQSECSVSNHNQMLQAVPQGSHCLPVTSVEDITKKRWADILAGLELETDLGISGNSITTTAEFQPHTASLEPQAFNQFVSQTNASQDMNQFAHSAVTSATNASQDMNQYAHSDAASATNASQDMNQFGHSAAVSINPDSLGFDCSWLNNTTAQSIPEHSRGEDPQLATVQPFEPPVFDSNPVSEVIPFESLFASLDQEPIPESSKDPVLMNQVPATLMYDFEDTWSGFGPVQFVSDQLLERGFS